MLLFSKDRRALYSYPPIILVTTLYYASHAGTVAETPAVRSESARKKKLSKCVRCAATTPAKNLTLSKGSTYIKRIMTCFASKGWKHGQTCKTSAAGMGLSIPTIKMELPQNNLISRAGG